MTFSQSAGSFATCSQVLYASFNQITCQVSGYFYPTEIDASVTVSSLCDCGMPGTTSMNSIATGVAAHSVNASSTILATNAAALTISGSFPSGWGIGNYSVQLSSGACNVSSVNASNIVCNFTSMPSIGSLAASVTFLTANNSATQVANIVQSKFDCYLKNFR